MLDQKYPVVAVSANLLWHAVYIACGNTIAVYFKNLSAIFAQLKEMIMMMMMMTQVVRDDTG